MYDYNFNSDGNSYFISLKHGLAIDMYHNALVQCYAPHTILMAASKVEQHCTMLSKAFRTTKIKKPQKGDFVVFTSDNSILSGFIIMVDRENKAFFTTGDEWDEIFYYHSKGRGFKVNAHIPAEKVREFLLENL